MIKTKLETRALDLIISKRGGINCYIYWANKLTINYEDYLYSMLQINNNACELALFGWLEKRLMLILILIYCERKTLLFR
jgi:hypothetical protein